MIGLVIALIFFFVVVIGFIATIWPSPEKYNKYKEAYDYEAPRVQSSSKED